MEIAIMSANKWLKILNDNRHLKIDKVEDGYLSRESLEKEWSLETSQTCKLIKDLKKIGKITEKRFRIKTGNKTYPVPHYKIIQSK